MIALVAPNSFKGSLNSPRVAAAMARGVRRRHPSAQIRLRPMADGGEGTLDVLVRALGGTYFSTLVQNPLGDPISARFGLVRRDSVAIVELAQCCGLSTLSRSRWDPTRASTYGLGQLLREARKLGAGRIIVAIGGSATNDGGAGMAQALGYRLLDGGGDELGAGGLELARLNRIEVGDFDRSWTDVELLVAVDVRNPLTGPRGATLSFGEQKGADQNMCRELELAMIHFQKHLGDGVGGLPGAGAAGGVGAGLVRFLGARLVPGAELVAEAIGLDRAILGADLVLTGEGRVDRQTTEGKGPAEVVRRATELGVPVLFVAGAKGEGWEGILESGQVRLETLPATNLSARDTSRGLEEAVWRALG